MARGLGKFSLSVRLATDEFKKSSDSVGDTFRKLTRRMRRQSATLNVSLKAIGATFRGLRSAARLAFRGIAVAAAGAITGFAGFGVVLGQTLDRFRELKQQAIEFGLTMEQTARFGALGRIAGADATEIMDAIREFNLRLGETRATGRGAQADAFRDILGFSATDVAGFKRDSETIIQILNRINTLAPDKRFFCDVGSVRQRGGKTRTVDEPARTVGRCRSFG